MRRWMIGLVLAGGAMLTMASTAADIQETCCLTNPRFKGTCQVTPGEGETCQDVLAFLNNPMAKGKTYCGNTDIRGGWKLVSCDER